MRLRLNTWLVFVSIFMGMYPDLASAQRNEAEIAQEAGVDEHLGEKIDLAAQVRDHFGQEITLQKYFLDGKPAVFTLNYYSCASLCSLQLNAVLDGLKELD